MRHKIIKWFKFKLQIIFRNERDFKDIILFDFSNFNLIIWLLANLGKNITPHACQINL